MVWGSEIPIGGGWRLPGEVAAPTHSRPTPIILIQGKVLSQPHAPAPSTPGGLPETRQEGLAEALALRLPRPVLHLSAPIPREACVLTASERSTWHKNSACVVWEHE